MCNNINYNRNVILVPFVFKTHTYLGQFFWHLVESPPFIPPKIWGRNWSDRHVDCWRRASVLPSSDHPHVLFTVPWVWWEDRAALRGCKNLLYFFLGGLRGGGGSMFLYFFFRIWYESSFFFWIWVFFCLTLDEFRVVFFWSWSHAVILGVGEQILTWEIFDQGRHSLMRLRRYRWWCAEKHRDPRPRWWWALCAQWKKSGLDLEKDRFLIRYF